MDVFVLAFFDALYASTTTFLLFNLLLRRKRKRPISYLLILIVVIGMAYFTMLRNWFPLFKTIVIIGGLLQFFNGTKPQKIISIASIMQFGMLIDFFHGIWLVVTSASMDSTNIERAALILLVVLNVLRKDKAPLIEYFNKQYILVWLLLTLNILLAASVLTSLEFSREMKALISGILLLTSGINIYFCYYLEKTRKLFEENLVITKQVEFQENKLAQNKAYLEKNNRLMHDIKKHYLEIEHALSENQLVYVKEYMKGVYKQYFENVEAVFTGNQVIDSMFFALKEQCDKEGISLQHSIHIDKKIKLDEKDLAVLLGSLFDHAVKCVKQSKQEREIMVTMKTELHHLTIVLSYAKEAPSVLSKKTIEYWENDQMIDRIIGKYHGMFEMNEEQEVGKMKVILPLEHESSL